MFRETLMTALNDAVGYYNAGMSDNDSVVKAASEHDFNADQAQRLVESFNTAKTIYFFKTADDRRDNFPIADPAVVIPQIFAPEAEEPEPVKEASSDGFHDYSEYDTPEARFGDTFDLDPDGNRRVEFEDVKIASDLTLDGLHRSMNRHIKVAQQTARRCSDTAAEMDLRYQMGLNKLAGLLNDDWDEPTKVAQAEHCFWASFSREISSPVIEDLMTAVTNSSEKRADVETDGIATDFEDRHPEIMTLMKEAIDARFGKAEMQAMATQFSKEAESLEQEWMQAAGLHKEPDPVDYFLAPGLADKEAQPLPTSPEKKAPASPATSTLLGKAIDTGIHEVGGAGVAALRPQLTGAVGSVLAGNDASEEKAMTERLRNLRRQLILEDLITNDPMLKGETPETIAHAYQSLIALAPDTSLNKEVTRAVLRNTVQTIALHQQDAKSLVELENEIQKQLNLKMDRVPGQVVKER